MIWPGFYLITFSKWWQLISINSEVLLEMLSWYFATFLKLKRGIYLRLKVSPQKKVNTTFVNVMIQKLSYFGSVMWRHSVFLKYVWSRSPTNLDPASIFPRSKNLLYSLPRSNTFDSLKPYQRIGLLWDGYPHKVSVVAVCMQQIRVGVTALSLIVKIYFTIQWKNIKIILSSTNWRLAFS